MKRRRKIEFGDFQTPIDLARQVCDLLNRTNYSAASVVEPTCGAGSFLVACEQAFPHCGTIQGYDINPEYVATAQSVTKRAQIQQADFFQFDWQSVLRNLAEPILVIGNPPWVTNSTVGAFNGTNLPKKSNFQGLSGFDAMTGKSNFDISEWMLMCLLESMAGRHAVLAMLCKTVVARKVLQRAWRTDMPIAKTALYGIDAQAHFGASVDACLLVCVLEPGAKSSDCQVFDSITTTTRKSTFALRDDRLIANLDAFATYAHLIGKSERKWRSGIKHDCARVMELRPDSCNSHYLNGWGEHIQLEDEFLYPMLKGSELIRQAKPSRMLLVTQRSIGEDTRDIEMRAPRTWRYLEQHRQALDARASSIYRNRPPYSIFGIGEYSFSPWKVAVSSFYKRLNFVVVAPLNDQPVVLDDTSYFLACQSQPEAEKLARLLNSEPARGFFDAFVFWDAKRPITISLLSTLSLDALAEECESERVSARFD